MSHPASEPAKIAERRKQVWKLRVKAWSIRDIAEKLEVSPATIHSDLEAVRVEVADETKTAALRHREVELARLDEWIRIGTERLEAFRVEPVSETPDGEVTEPPHSDDAIAPLLNSLKGLSERRAKLLGLDAAIKSELSGPEGGPVQVEDARARLIAKLSGLATGEPSEAETTEPPGSTEP